MKKLCSLLCIILLIHVASWAQALRIPQSGNISCMAGRKLGLTEIEIRWNAPGVKGREGKIWGTPVAYYGTSVLGFGSEVASPWRAGADEATVISFSTDVKINGKALKAGKYALFMELQADSSTLIFNKNTREWGSYFYDKNQDVLRVGTRQFKNKNPMVERLNYVFTDQTEQSVALSLEWEHWSIPMTIEVNNKENILAYIKAEMSSELGFDPASLEAAARWCLDNDINLEQALSWINAATSPSLGGANSFAVLSTKADLLNKLGKPSDAEKIMNDAVEKAGTMELHQYGRRLLAAKAVDKAFDIFQKNVTKSNGAWPTNAGMMRVYSAKGDYKKALEYAKKALPQAPDDVNKNFISNAIKTLESGKPI